LHLQCLKMKKISIAILTISLVGAVVFFRLQTTSPFLKACQTHLKNKKLVSALDTDLCSKIEKQFFSGDDNVQNILPSKVGATELPIDDEVRFIAFNDPAYFSSYAYCYFAFKEWFNPESLAPDQMAIAASGFAILKKELEGYKEWLASTKGQSCSRAIKTSLNLEVIDLEQEMGEKVSIIAINPIGAIRSDNGLGEVIKEAV